MMDYLPRDEFYTQRDDRTDSKTDARDYQTASFLVAGEREVLETYTGRVMARTVANLLSRFARDVELELPSVAPDTELPPAAHTLPEQCLRQMLDADPHGYFGCVSRSATNEYDCALVIGDPDTELRADTTLYLDASRWVAHVSREEPIDVACARDENPIGSIAAACLAGAEAFKTVSELPDRQLTEEITYDVFNHEVNPEATGERSPRLSTSIELGTVQMIGVGSVGSAAVRFLGRLPVSGRLQLVDHDEVELVNLNRSPLFEAKHAFQRTAKVDVAKRFLDGSDLKVSAHDETYASFTATETEQPDLVLPLANEENVRWDIQHSRPPVMVHATTSGADVTLRRNIPVDDACLLCHFPATSPEIDAPCATESVSSDDGGDSDTGSDAALPFASFLAGCFIAAELAKLPSDAYPVTRSVARVQTLSDIGGGVLEYSKNRESDCAYCAGDPHEFHRQRIEGTCFDYLTTAQTD